MVHHSRQPTFSSKYPPAEPAYEIAPSLYMKSYPQTEESFFPDLGDANPI